MNPLPVLLPVQWQLSNAILVVELVIFKVHRYTWSPCSFSSSEYSRVSELESSVKPEVLCTFLSPLLKVISLSADRTVADLATSLEAVLQAPEEALLRELLLPAVV